MNECQNVWFRKLSGLVTLPGALVLVAAGCTERPPIPVLRSLQASGTATFLCRAPDGTGRSMDSCQFQSNSVYALITQTLSGEVAVANISAFKLVDVDPSTPGMTALRVGAAPGDLVTSPGGAASFVGVGELGKSGIFTLPTTCLSAPRSSEETVRDLTSFPACSLPSAPGNLAIFVDPPRIDAEDRSLIRQSCDGSRGPEIPGALPIGAQRADCPVNLTAEEGPRGRRKLLVSLPDSGEVAVIDAQELADREPGSFDPCRIEALLPLRVDLPASEIRQNVPPDLRADGCAPLTRPVPPRPSVFRPRPAGFAPAERALYVSDAEAPVIHVLDVSDPCVPTEKPPLLPVSFVDSKRVVTTSQIALSPATPSGKRFVYALDQTDQPFASVMAFDVSPGATERTPLVLPGASRHPYDPPDRITFGAPVRDFTFALRDKPAVDPTTGVGMIGTLCDPNPAPPEDAGALYRPSSTGGASPGNWRGVFGFAITSTAQIHLVDVEDFDAPCRRPVTTNSASFEDFRGCVGDPASFPKLLTLDGTEATPPAVTNEVSCRTVQPHRRRSRYPTRNATDIGLHAPALRTFPQLRLPNSSSSSLTSQPTLLGVDFPNPDPAAQGQPIPAEVNVGFTAFKRGSSENPLDIDPRTAPDYSVVLPLAEPRSYIVDEQMYLTYEGGIAARSPGFLRLKDASQASTPGLLTDASALFCDLGVHDTRVMFELGQAELGLSADKLERFTRDHADHVVLLSDFPAAADAYWAGAAGASCGGRSGCVEEFGAFDAKVLSPTREFRILEAYQDKLVVEPRAYADEAERQRRMERADCCFPSGASYAVRASRNWVLSGSQTGVRHDIVPVAQPQAGGGTALRCARSCDPRKRWFKSRAFEIASSRQCAPEAADCRVGRATADDVCVYDDSSGPVTPGGPGAACIFQSLTARFALYRGIEPSVPGMSFSWQTTGSFIPYSLAYAAPSEAGRAMPQTLLSVPQYRWLVVVDGVDQGLKFFSLDTLTFFDPLR